MNDIRKRVLCIEDEREPAALIAEDLGERGYDVAVAHDGYAGFAAILREPPDIVLCDISMPAQSGFDVLERLTATAPRLGNIPFIFVTALADRENELRGRMLGADDFVTKPIDFDMLSMIVSARLARVARDDVWPKRYALSERETEALSWAARGKTSAEIAKIMGLRKRTVDFHIDNARNKLDTTTRIEAVIKAVSGGLIQP
jgi:DNA-binding response OmpR family regulator